MCILRVRRSRLMEDALSEIGRQSRRDLMKPLRVHFIGEVSGRTPRCSQISAPSLQEMGLSLQDALANVSSVNAALA